MVVKLYGHPLSPAGLRVALILKELGVPYQDITIDLGAAQQQKSPEYKAKQPFGQVPCLDDDGFIVYESRAICRYIADKYAKPEKQWIPKGTQAVALFEQAASAEGAHFVQPALKLIGQKFFNPMFGSPIDEAVVAENVEKLNSVLAVYDQILSKQKYLAGDQLTLVDFFHIPEAHLVEKVGLLSLDDKPNVARWWRDISTRPAWHAIKVENKEFGFPIIKVPTPVPQSSIPSDLVALVPILKQFARPLYFERAILILALFIILKQYASS